MTNHFSAKRCWVSTPPRPGAEEMASALGVHLLIAQILLNRGITDPGKARAFLNPRLEDLLDPFTLPDLERATLRLLDAIRRGERITIYGDYDADGVTSTAILVRTLRELGVESWEFEYYIPKRLVEGYGLSRAAIERLHRAGTKLLVAVDCGVTAVEEIAFARSLGIDVIVLDHHEPPQDRGQSLVASDCWLITSHPGGLCAAGLAFQLSRALRRTIRDVGSRELGVGRDPINQIDQIDHTDQYVDLAAVGTVADVVPLLGDNRILVHAGLQRLNTSPILGLQALKKVAGLLGAVTSRDISHIIAPRLNASGRMGDASPACELLITEDEEEAHALARYLDEQNRIRQDACDRALAEALEALEAQDVSTERAIVLASPHWHPGVVGIVASRLVERFHRPTILIAIEDGLGRGSARSIPGFHLVEALSTCKDLLIKYGGHASAAGLLLEKDAVSAFRERFLETSRRALREEDLLPTVVLDAEISLPQISSDLVRQIRLLQPFGAGNPEPTFGCRRAKVLLSRPVGASRGTAAPCPYKLALTDGVAYVEAIGFGLADLSEVLAFTGTTVDAAFSIDLARGEGDPIRLIVKDLQTPEVDLDHILSDASLLVERLFSRAEDYLTGSVLRGIEEAETFTTRVAGVTYEGRQEIISRLAPGTPLHLVREPQNPHDPHAVKVVTTDGLHLGYLPARFAGRLAPAMDAGARYEAVVSQVTGGEEGRYYGLLLSVHRLPPDGEEAEDRLRREALSHLAPSNLIERLSIHFLPGRPLPSHVAALVESALRGERTLAVISPRSGAVRAADMAAVAVAIRRQRPVVLALPLSSEVDDRVEELGSRVRDLGLKVLGFHGALPPWRREAAWSAIRALPADVIVASWEFLHRNGEFVSSLDPGAVLFEVTRLSPKELAEVKDLIEVLGRPNPLLLAFEAAEEIARNARDSLDLSRLVVDTTLSTEVRLVDRRGSADPEGYILGVLSKGDPTVIFTNRREQAVMLARSLREKLPELGHRLAYYHGGLPLRVRQVLTRLFRDGHLQTLVATGSLTEAVPLLEARHVMLASVPFTRRQMLLEAAAGRMRASTVHLVYAPEDVEANRKVVEGRFPSREILGGVYRALRLVYNDLGSLLWPDETLARTIEEVVPGLSKATVEICLDILAEVGVVASEYEEGRLHLHILTTEERRDLTRVLRFAEGVRERQALEEAADWALGSSAQELLESIAGPAFRGAEERRSGGEEGLRGRGASQ